MSSFTRSVHWKQRIGTILLIVGSILITLLMGRPTYDRELLQLQRVTCTEGIDKKSLLPQYRIRQAEDVHIVVGSTTNITSYGGQNKKAVLVIYDSDTHKTRTCAIRYGQEQISAPLSEFAPGASSAYLEFYTEKASDAHLIVNYITSPIQGSDPIRALNTSKENLGNRRLAAVTQNFRYVLPLPETVSAEGTRLRLNNPNDHEIEFSVEALNNPNDSQSVAVATKQSMTLNLAGGIRKIIPKTNKSFYAATADTSALIKQSERVLIPVDKALSGTSHLIPMTIGKKQGYLIQIANIRSKPQKISIKIFDIDGLLIDIPAEQCSVPISPNGVTLKPFEELLCHIVESQKTNKIARFEFDGKSYLAQVSFSERLKSREILQVRRPQPAQFFRNQSGVTTFTTGNFLNNLYRFMLVNPTSELSTTNISYLQSPIITQEESITLPAYSSKVIPITQSVVGIKLRGSDQTLAQVRDKEGNIIASVAENDLPSNPQSPSAPAQPFRPKLAIVRPASQIAIGRDQSKAITIDIRCRTMPPAPGLYTYQYTILRFDKFDKEGKKLTPILSNSLTPDCTGRATFTQSMLSQGLNYLIRIQALSVSDPKTTTLSAKRAFSFSKVNDIVTPSPFPSAIATASATETITPQADATKPLAPTKTNTVAPTATAQATNTSTIAPTNTNTALPTATPRPTDTPLPLATNTPTATLTATAKNTSPPDNCPEDPLKLEPGICGCGTPDLDSDGDKSADCIDRCPNDPNKTTPGDCGCGVKEGDCKLDSDGDGIPDITASERLDSDTDGILDAFEPNTIDSDLDGLKNHLDADDDNDGITTKVECPTGFPCIDSDKDGVPDYLERNGRDTDGDKLLDWKDDDDDGDGKKTKDETGTEDPRLVFKDTDNGGKGDGVPDYLDAGDADTDTDTKTDASEYTLTCNATNAPECGAQKDSDKDTTPDHNDACDQDPKKFRPGACGCGIEDKDTDKDGSYDCTDTCKDDPKKTAPGACGCGVADTDTDGDGTPDCNDKCKNDPKKTDPGSCGCGTADTDTDNDRTPDCLDKCPSDSGKIAAGICGCGVSDADNDGDGSPNCNDNCPNDSNKTSAGICGCNKSDKDTDGDNTADCKDECPAHSGKTSPGICGCATADTDTDTDGIADCKDGCPNDKLKNAPGSCGCGVADTDTDSDGTPNCKDQCPDDKNKTEAGKCGCNKAENSCDKEDLCPNDPNKSEPGYCGCGEPELDNDNDGIIDCGKNQTSDAASNDSPFKRETVQLAAVEAVKKLADLLNTPGNPIKIDPNAHVLEKGTAISFIADASCVAQAKLSEYFNSFITPEDRARAALIANQTLKSEMYHGKLGAPITFQALKGKVAEDPCMSGVSDPPKETDKTVSENLNDPLYSKQTYLRDIKFPEAFPYFNAEATKRVIVATIDSGYDFNSSDRPEFAEMLVGSNIAEQFDPIGEDGNKGQDTYGHGTAVGSIIVAAQDNGQGIAGIAAKQVQLLPIKLMRGGSLANGRARLIQSIRYAVNAGAKIVNMSLGETNSLFCDPLVGEAIYMAIEKGVFFVFSSGNGYPDKNGVPVPIELKAATDDGPQDFGRTMSPACWGEYFKGAITVAASTSNAGTQSLAPFSNYGHAVEIIAPGAGITSNGIANTTSIQSGTSLSAPQVTAAAALILSMAKSKNWYISPWLLEDMLLNGTPSNDALKSVVNDGKYLDLKKLKDYAVTLAAMTPDERSRIPSKNQRVGDGWDPEADIENVDYISISSDRAFLKVGEQAQFKAQVIFRNGTTQDITEDPKVFWTAQFQPDAKTSIGAKTGLFKLLSEIKDSASIRIIAHFGDYEGETTISLAPKDGDILESLRLVAPENIRWGAHIKTKVIAKYKSKTEIDVTNIASIQSNNQSEFEVSSLIPGLVTTRNSYGGKVYTLSANYQGSSIQQSIAVSKVPLVLKIKNALGNAFKGQTIRLRAQIEDATEVYDLPSLGSWTSLTPGLSLNQQNVSEVLIPTETLALGAYRIKAEVPFKGMGENTVLTETITINVVSNFDRLSLLTKTPVIQYRDRAVFSLRFFTSNNSYSVIDPSRIAWTTSDPALPIDAQGIVYPTFQSLNDGKPKQYTIFAEFLGAKASAQITVTPVSVVSGQAAEISYISISPRVLYDPNLENCKYSQRKECLRLKMSSAWNSMSFKMTAFYTNGTTRDISGFSNLTSSHPQKLQARSNWGGDSVGGNGIELVGLLAASRGNETYLLTALYDGYKADFPVDVVPTTKVEFDYFSLFPEANSTPSYYRANDLMTFSDVRPDREIFTFLKYTDELNRTKQMRVRQSEGELLSQDLSIFKYIDSATKTISVKDMPYDLEKSMIFNYDHVSFGFQKQFTIPIRFKKYRTEPNTLDTRLDVPTSTQVLPGMPLETSLSSWCSLQMTNGERRGIPCKDVNYSLKYENSSEPVKGVGYSRSLTDATTQWLIYDTANIGRIVKVDAEYSLNPALKSSFTFPIMRGIDYIPPHPYVKQPIPSYNPQPKEKDIFCNPENSAKDPVAGGTGLEVDPYKICSAKQFLALNNLVNPNTQMIHVQLLNNIDLASVVGMQPIAIKQSLNLNGNGYAISNFTIIDRERSEMGLFSLSRDFNGKELKANSIILINPVVRGLDFVGALTGKEVGSLENIVIKGGVIWGRNFVGSVAGSILGTTNKVLVEDTKVNGERGGVGGVYGGASGIIMNVRSSAELNAIGVQGLSGVYGGIAGYYQGFLAYIQQNNPAPVFDDQRNRYMFNTHFSGEINVGSTTRGYSDTGGLIGWGTGPIMDCSVDAQIVTIGSAAGGLIGRLRGQIDKVSRFDYDGLVYNSSFKGSIIGGKDIQGASDVGGLIGSTKGGMIFNSHVLPGTILRGVSAVGGLIGSATGLSRIHNSSADVTVTSSTETEAGFIGICTDEVYIFDNEPRQVSLKNIYSGNTWKLKNQISQSDIGIYRRSDGLFRNADVEGIN